MYNEQRLLNKKTIVTGGARGIGAGIVRRLYAEGAEIIISDFREELALDLIQELDQDKGNISFHKTDLSKEEEIIKYPKRLFIGFEKGTEKSDYEAAEKLAINYVKDNFSSRRNSYIKIEKIKKTM